ncbi:hypothetical protein ACOTVM_00770 [Aliarcobacter butzleri]
MKNEIDIIKNIYAIEEELKKCINNKESIPKNILAVLDEAKYSVNRLSEIVKIYKVSNE